MYTLDTNAVIYYLKGDSPAVVALENILKQPSPIYISSITEAELLGFPDLGDRELEQLGAFIKTLSIIPLDSQLAKLSGLLRRQYKLKLADSAIAATAIFTHSTLITRNIRDFKRIRGLPLLKI